MGGTLRAYYEYDEYKERAPIFGAYRVRQSGDTCGEVVSNGRIASRTLRLCVLIRRTEDEVLARGIIRSGPNHELFRRNSATNGMGPSVGLSRQGSLVERFFFSAGGKE